MNLFWVEAVIAAAGALNFFIMARFQLKAEHLGARPGLVWAGAALNGLILGSIVAFVLLPLRLRAMDAGPEGITLLPWLGAAALLLSFRSGLIARLPLIGAPFRAYRLASLRYAVAIAQGRIARLEALDAPADRGRSGSREG